MDTTPLFGVPLTQALDGTALRLPPQAGPNTAPPSGSVPLEGYKEQDGKHKGFAGVARDILGTLGDFLLTRLHMPAMYGPSQKSRKLAAAESGIETDPAAAIARVTSLDPVFGAKLRDQQIDNTRLQGNADALKEARDARIAMAREAADNKNRLISTSFLNTLTRVPEKDRATTYPAIRARIIAQNPGMEKELPETYDPIAVNGILDSGVPLGLQRGQALTAERNAVTERQGEERIGVARDRNRISETQGDRRLDQGDRKITVGERQGDRRLDIADRGERNRDARTGERIKTSKDIANQRDATTRRGQDSKGFIPDPNKIYIQGGHKFKYVNGKVQKID